MGGFILQAPLPAYFYANVMIEMIMLQAIRLYYSKFACHKTY